MKRADMKCDICGKGNPVVHVQQIMGNETIDLRLCDACAREKGIRSDRIEATLAGILSGLVEVKTRARKQEERKTCAKCGTTFAGFRKTGVTGCTECFTEFRKEITSLLDRMAPSAQHRGKYPKKLLTYKTFFVDRERLKQKLALALEKEEYEAAAGIRDRIRALEESGEAPHD